MYSMTGYGKGVCEAPDKIYTLELRAVNHRFLEVKFRLPKGMLFIEENIDKSIKGSFERGSFSVYLNIEANSERQQEFHIDYQLAEAYYNAGNALKEHFGLPYGLTLQDLIRYPEVLSANGSEEADDELWSHIHEALTMACGNLKEMRLNEGLKLKQDFHERLAIIEENLKLVEGYSDRIVEEYRDRLSDRISSLLDAVPVNEDRIAYEVAAFADKSNITEEITRLGIHLQHFREFLEAKVPVGRKLDFLIQEMNREVNTIGSKSSSTDIAAIIVTMKSEMEKIREQVQNIE